MTKHKSISKGESACCLLPLILLLAGVAMVARANTATPSNCIKAAMAAKEARHMNVTQGKNVWERKFIAVSQILWHHARGDEARFLRWYREACETQRAPDYFRVRDGEILMEREV